MANLGPNTAGSGRDHPAGKKRVILFAESGLLAGDLAAWLSGAFLVERVTSIPGALLALGQPAAALIIVEGESFGTTGPADELVQRAAKSGNRAIILGMEPSSAPASWDGLAIHLSALPAPGDLFNALANLPPMAGRAKA